MRNSSFPVVHPCKPNKDDQVKDCSYDLMQYTDEKPRIIVIPVTGVNGNQQEILKEAFPYPRSSIQTVIEKSSPLKNQSNHSNSRAVSSNARKHYFKKKQPNKSSATFQSNSEIVTLLHDETPKLDVDEGQLQHIDSIVEEDLKLELESLAKEVEQKNYTALKCEHLLLELIKEIALIRSSLGTEATSRNINEEVNMEDLPEDWSSIELFASNTIEDLKLSVASCLHEKKTMKAQLRSLLKDNESYEKQTSKLKKSLTLLLKRFKKGKEDQKPYYSEVPDVIHS